MNFLLCVRTTDFGDFSTDDLTVGRLYEVLDNADSKDMIRIIDDSGEDYLYPSTLFEPVHLPIKATERLHIALGLSRNRIVHLS